MKPLNPNSFLVKATLLLSSSLTVMAGATIAPSLPALRDYFAATPNADYWVRLVLTMPALFIAIGAPFVGTIIDRFGPKPLLALAVLLYGIAGSSGAVLNAIGLILIGRVLLGLSVAGIMTTATALIADYYVGYATNAAGSRPGRVDDSVLSRSVYFADSQSTAGQRDWLASYLSTGRWSHGSHGRDRCGSGLALEVSDYPVRELRSHLTEFVRIERWRTDCGTYSNMDAVCRQG